LMTSASINFGSPNRNEEKVNNKMNQIVHSHQSFVGRTDMFNNHAVFLSSSLDGVARDGPLALQQGDMFSPEDTSTVFSLGSSFDSINKASTGSVGKNVVPEKKRNQSSMHNCMPFPWKVHEMLNDAESEGIDSVASWLPDGTSFKVFNTKLFVEMIMPRYFNQTKYKSFQRQLNIWGFERIQEGAERGGYSHHFLLRDNVSLCRHMKRTRVKGNGQPRSSSLVPSLQEQKEEEDKSAEYAPSRASSSTPSPPPLTPKVTQEDFQVVTPPPPSSCPKTVSVPSSLNIQASAKLAEPASQVSSRYLLPLNMNEIMHNEAFFSSSFGAPPCADSQNGDCMLFEGRMFHLVEDYPESNFAE
jgi:hypothetical protein